MVYRLLCTTQVLLLALVCQISSAQTLKLPPRPADALTGSELVQMLTPLPWQEREKAILKQVELGNMPGFMRALVPVSVTATINGCTHTAVYYVTPDYLCLGSQLDYFLTPMTPRLAQKIADKLGCNLPTRKMVDDIYNAATTKLIPIPIPPSARMITVPVFAKHNRMVAGQRAFHLPKHLPGSLIAGHKKDVVITPLLAQKPKKVAIYGWHLPGGKPIQPLNVGHVYWYADYSHGIRLVQLAMKVGGNLTTVNKVLGDKQLCPLLSDEGSFSCSYETRTALRIIDKANTQ
jgi:hypothetical protein